MANLKYSLEMLQLYARSNITLILLLSILILACSESDRKLSIDLSPEDYSRERAENVKILYSDSAIVKMKIESPLMYRYVENRKSIEEFPKGLLVEFYDDRQNVTSWLEADYALRKESENIILLKDNVSFYNKRNEKLETDELIYNNAQNQISTDKFVKITQPAKGDTSWGLGFITDEEFNRFEIKNRYSGTKTIDEMQKIIEGH